MKIAAIKRMCLGERMCRILTGQQGQQWIGTNGCIVRVDDGLRISKESVKGLFDLDPMQTEKLLIIEEDLETSDIWPVMRIPQNKMSVCPLDFNGVEALSCNGGMLLCSKAAIKTAVETGDYREYLLGWDREHRPVIIIYDGMIFAGLVRPKRIDASRFFATAMKIWSELKPAGFNAEAPEETEAPEGEQVAMV